MKEHEISPRIEGIQTDKYYILDKTIIMFMINAIFGSHKNFKSVSLSNICVMKGNYKRLSKEDIHIRVKNDYCSLIKPNEEIRLCSGYRWIKVDYVNTLGYIETNSYLECLDAKGLSSFSLIKKICNEAYGIRIAKVDVVMAHNGYEEMKLHIQPYVAAK